MAWLGAQALVCVPGLILGFGMTDLLVGDSSVFRNIPRKEMLKLKSHTFSLRNLPSKASAHPRRDHRDSRWSLRLMDASSKQALKVPGKLLTGNVSSENCLLRLSSK